MTDVKKVVRDFYQSYNERELDVTWQRYLSADLINHAMGGAYQRVQWLEFVKELLSALAGLRVDVLDQVSEGDRVATRFVITGTHTGQFLGIPPRGNWAVLGGTSFDRIVGGQIAEHWADIDLGAFLQQLAVPRAN